MTSTSSSQAKVRVACQRCRAKRIRCDGNEPSCANCAKAGAACVDVDARNASKIIPRNTVAQAKARIQWLEDIIRKELPAVDLEDGPQVDLEFPGDFVSEPLTDSGLPSTGVGSSSSATVSNNITPGPASGVGKRNYASLADDNDEQAFSTEARSVAHDLGRLSLHADSREKHYLGSSSGLVFSYLVQTGSPSTETNASPSRPRHLRTHRNSKHDFRPIYEKLVATLPTKEDALHLFEVYLCYIHPDHPVLHLQSILDALEALFICKDFTEFDQVDEYGWPEGMTPFAYNGELNGGLTTPISMPTATFHIFMLFTIAASVKTGGIQNEFAPAKFYRVATAIAPDVLGETSIASLQAIYLMAVHAFMSPAKLNIWTLTYVCMAHAIDMGIHRQQGDVPPAVKVTRALLFYSIYSLDRSVATIQGRPLGIRDETFDISLPTLTELEEELGSQKISSVYTLLAQGTSHYTIHRFKLDRIISEIKTLFYFLPSQTKSTIWSTDHGAHKIRLHSGLDDWYTKVAEIASQLPVHDSEKRRWCLHLEQLYHAAIILLFQPSQVFREPDADSLHVCFNAATQQISCYNSIYEQDMLQFDWRTVRSIFASGTTIIYCFWKSKDLGRYRTQMATTLRICTSLLTVGGIWWPSVKKAKSSFERLVDLSLQRIDDESRTESGRANKRKAPQLNSASTLNATDRPNSSHPPTQRQTNFVQDSDGVWDPSVGDSIHNPVYRNQSVQQAFETNLYWPQSADSFTAAPLSDDNAEYGFGYDASLENPDSGIEEILQGFFTEDNSWNSSIADSSWPFYFGNL